MTELKTYLFYVRKYNILARDYVLYIYRCKTNDPYHTIGEIVYRTFEQIQRIDFVEETKSSLEYWKQEGKEIYEWNDKYNQM